MARFGATIANLVGKVEILARGGDELRRATEQALETHHPARALALARRLKERVPDAALALALWADAAEACGLDHEQCDALDALARLVPWRSELWLRLGQLALRTGHPVAREALERAAIAPGDALRVGEALLALCDLELAAREPARALRWLDRRATDRNDLDGEWLLRRAECCHALGAHAQAKSLAERLGPPGRGDGRDRLLMARVLESAVEPAVRARALEHAIGAVVLGATGAEATLLGLVVTLPGLSERLARPLAARIRSVLEQLGIARSDHCRAALLLADGSTAAAMEVLRAGLAEGQEGSAALLISLATESEDAAGLSAVAERLPDAIPAGHRRLLDAIRHAEQGRETDAMAMLARADGPLAGWARRVADQMVARWLPGAARETPTAWPAILGELRAACRVLDDATALEQIDAIAKQRELPLQVAFVGEFNAGKSTLVNAWLGAEVAPTGVLPTTQSVHRVAWAPEPFVRIGVQGQPDRVVLHAQLNHALTAIEQRGGEVVEVLIYAPLEPLRWVELLDTPGLNAPDHRGRQLTVAAVRNAHLALWIFDATSPLKESERQALADVAQAGVPIMPIVNKLDRLAPTEQLAVLRYVEESLRGAAIEPYRAPVGVSAKLALSERLSGDGATGQSNWANLEQLLEREVFDHAGLLREAALRRRARVVTQRLVVEAQRRATRAEQARSEHAAMHDALGRVARRLELDLGAAARRLVPSLRAAIDALELDLRPLGRHGRAHRVDEAEVRDYLVERTVQRIAPPLVAAIAQLASAEEPLLAAATPALGPLLEPVVRGVLAGAVGALGTELPGAAVLDRVVEAAVRAAAWQLREQTTSPPVVADAVDIAWRLQRVAARFDALEAGAAAGPAPSPEPGH